MRPELPQGFDDRDVMAVLDKVSRAHWELMPEHGLPQTSRAKALRALGQFLFRKLTNGKLAMDEKTPPIAPFAATVGAIKHHFEFDRVLDEVDDL
jgi:hypothetical protein